MLQKALRRMCVCMVACNGNVHEGAYYIIIFYFYFFIIFLLFLIIVHTYLEGSFERLQSIAHPNQLRLRSQVRDAMLKDTKDH